MRKIQVKLQIKNPELKEIFVKIIKTANQFKIAADGGLTPDLFIYEMSRDYENALKYLQKILQKKPGIEIFIVSEKPEPEMLIEILRLGIKEFFPVPVETDSIRDAFDRFIERFQTSQQSKPGHSGRIFSVIGSKGGVGTTTIAVNLAASIADMQKEPSVALLDMNILFGEVPMFLDMAPKHDWGDITKNIERLDEVFLDNILSKHESGINILPSPRYLGNHHTPTPPIIEVLLILMKERYDYIVIDLGQSINETALKVLNMSEIIHIVAIQSLPCLSNTNRLIKSIVEFGYVEKENINIVLNRYVKNGIVSIDSAEEGIGLKMSWVIPNDYSTTMTAINSGTPLYRLAGKSKIANCFRDYVEKLMPDEDRKKNRKKWFFNLM